MVEIKLNETIKYKGLWYYANSTIQVEDKDAKELSKYGEILVEGIVPTVVDEDGEKRKRTKRKS